MPLIHKADAKTGHAFRMRHETLRSLLRRNGEALELLCDLEADLRHLHYSDFRIRRPIERLADETLLMAQELNLLSGGRHRALYERISRIRGQIRLFLQRPPESGARPIAVSLEAEECLDPGLVGGKATGVASLGHIFPGQTPPGFVVTTEAYRLVLEENNLIDRIRLLLKDIDTVADRDQFQGRAARIRDWVREACLPAAVSEQIETQAAATPGIGTEGWAVRSSATSEDGRFSFAGQFESELRVPREELAEAYLSVLASRFTDRAIKYRIHCSFREIDTPMAVLFMPMIKPQAAGVIYTMDPQSVSPERMMINCVPGLGDRVVKGHVKADTVYISREQSPRIIEVLPAFSESAESVFDYLPEKTLLEIGKMAFLAKETLGQEMDIEWAADQEEQVWLLQGRRLTAGSAERIKEEKRKQQLPVIEGGMTVFPGRAEGNVFFFSPGGSLEAIPKACVLVVDQPTPELTEVVPRLAAILAAEGNPVGHLGALIREFSVPAIIRLGKRIQVLGDSSLVSVDATKRKVYRGSRWPGIRERVLARVSSASKGESMGPLHELVLSLNLTDPFSSSFNVKSCKSFHDVIRFIHEMAVRSMFWFGDQHNRLWKKSRRLRTHLPFKLHLIDLEGVVPERRRTVEPAEVASVPFGALWRGLSDERLHWPERWDREFRGLPTDFQEQVLGGTRGPRRRRDPRYAIVGHDYLNINARFAYHYAMVDAMVSAGEAHNYVHFRFHGGGASAEKKERRARFMESVLRQLGFDVDRRGELLIAWLRHYPLSDSETALEMLGRLLVCAQQLDLVMRSEEDVGWYTQHFMAGDYHLFFDLERA